MRPSVLAARRPGDAGNTSMLGVGVVWVPGLEPLLEPGAGIVDLVEVEPQTVWRYRPELPEPFALQDGVAEFLQRTGLPILVHGVGGPVGGSCLPDKAFLAAFRAVIRQFGSPWASEHLAFSYVNRSEGPWFTGFMFPPLQTEAGARVAAATVRQVRDALSVPFAVETAVNYLRPRPGELSDGEFVAHVVKGAGCDILLDLHNIWTNERNGRQSAREFLETIPLSRVREIHIGGGLEHEGFWLDAHSGAAPDEVLQLTEWALPRLDNLQAINFEILPGYLDRLGLDGVVSQVDAIRRLWSATRRVESLDSPSLRLHVSAMTEGDFLEASEWEASVAAALPGAPAPEQAHGASLRDDPGIVLAAKLTRDLRRGAIADMMGLTCKLLLVSGGVPLLERVVDGFVASEPPQAFATEEARRFARHLQALTAEIPYLHEVLAIELAKIEATLAGTDQVVSLSCDPNAIVRAIALSRRPEQVATGSFEFVVTP